MMTQRWFSLVFVAIALSLTSCNPPEPLSSRPGESASDRVETPGKIPGETTQATQPQPNSSGTPAKTDAAKSTDAPPAGDPASTTAPKGAPKPQTAPQAASKSATSEIKIDETVCGAGGQEAYFETKKQEIYICKNEAAALTYIATPKKKGNSIFLPAQKIQQGDIVGYAALDDSKTYIVTPGGFQLQENSKTLQSEKVIRRQLASQ
jgi:hypothetical protein